MTEQQTILLEALAPGARAVVRELRGGTTFASRVAGMGISLGCHVEVLQNPAHGPLLVRVRGTRIALVHGEASKIVVTELRGERPTSDE